MPASVILRPIEAKLKHNTMLIGKMSPYCMFRIDGEQLTTDTCRKGGKRPFWRRSVTFPVTIRHRTCLVIVKDENVLLPDEDIGAFEINLRELELKGNSKQWYPIYLKGKHSGDILLEGSFDYKSYSATAEDRQGPATAYAASKDLKKSKSMGSKILGSAQSVSNVTDGVVSMYKVESVEWNGDHFGGKSESNDEMGHYEVL